VRQYIGQAACPNLRGIQGTVNLRGGRIRTWPHHLDSSAAVLTESSTRPPVHLRAPSVAPNCWGYGVALSSGRSSLSPRLVPAGETAIYQLR